MVVVLLNGLDVGGDTMISMVRLEWYGVMSGLVLALDKSNRLMVY